MLKLKIIDPQKPDQVQEVDLNPESMLSNECLIGRFTNCDLVLDSAEISRMHGKICYKNENYYFADLGSRCGSRINGESAQINQEYQLQAHDMIQIGRFFLMVVDFNSQTDPRGLQEDITVVEKKEVPSKTQKIVESVAKPPCISPNEYMPVAMVEPSQLQRWAKGELTVRCIDIIDETHDVKTFRFVADPPVLFTYKPGQFVTLDLEINGEQVSRSYSISSTPSRPHTLEITVKRVLAPPNSGEDIPQGLVSNWLHDNVSVGGTITLSGPLGKFTCFENPSQKLLLISAGSGITPMMSMSRWLLDTGANCDIVFFHCARSPRDIIFRQELELLSARHPNFRLAVSTTRKEPGHSWLSLTGRLDANMLQVVAPDFRDRTVYVCGPNPFMESVSEMLENISFPMENYYEESFGPPRKKSKPASSNTDKKQATPNIQQPSLKDIFKNLQPAEDPSIQPSVESTPKHSTPVAHIPQIAVVFSKSDKEAPTDGEESILNLALQNNVKIRSSCLAGVCGSCKKRKLHGQVRLEGEPEALEESDVEQGYILTCISYPVGRVVIEA